MSSNITRRTAIGAIASVSATGGAGAALAADQYQAAENASSALAASSRPEMASEKVARLAQELSKALDELNADAYSTEYDDFAEVSIFVAHVWPYSVNPHVCLEAKDIPGRLAAFAARQIAGRLS